MDLNTFLSFWSATCFHGVLSCSTPEKSEHDSFFSVSQPWQVSSKKKKKSYDKVIYQEPVGMPRRRQCYDAMKSSAPLCFLAGGNGRSSRGNIWHIKETVLCVSPPHISLKTNQSLRSDDVDDVHGACSLQHSSRQSWQVFEWSRLRGDSEILLFYAFTFPLPYVCLQ